MKKLALLALGVVMATATCYADAQGYVNCSDSRYVQKYVMDIFHEQYPDLALVSRTDTRVTYFEKKPLTDPKQKEKVIGQVRHEVSFTTEVEGDKTILGIQQRNVNNYHDGKVETVKVSDDLDDLLFINEYRAFFNDAYSFCFAPAVKPNKEGVPIANVYSYGPMHDAGIKNGAVVVAVNGVKVLEHVKEFQNFVLPDKFSSEEATFTIAEKGVSKDYFLKPVIKESKYTEILQKRAKAMQEKKEGKRGIESWLKL